MVRDSAPAPASAEQSGDSWANCVAGTLAPECFLQLLEDTGFTDATLVATTGYRTSAETVGALFRARKRGF